MKYTILADTYEKLENTPKKLEKADIIAELLKNTNYEILPDVVLLLSGRIFPEWSDKDIGVANNLLIKAIHKATGVNEKEIIDKFNKTGDLGLVAEFFDSEKRQATLVSQQLTVKKVFENLQELAEQEGKGSQDRKLALISELLAQATPKEAKYVARTVLEQLRVGVAEGIIRDAIAKAFDVGVKETERAFFLRPHYGEIAQLASKGGEKALNKVSIKLGTPFHIQLAEKTPDLKTAFESFENSGLEFKYDGMRTIIHKNGSKIWLFTRRLEDVTAAFPDIVELCKNNIKPKECVLDCETVGLNPETNRTIPFQQLSTRIKRKYDIKNTIKEIPVQINIFDILYLDGDSLFDMPQKDRRAILEHTITQDHGKFQLSEQLTTRDLGKAEEFYKKSLAAGEEGVIVKNLDAFYQPGRRVSGGWLKVKPVMENLDLVVVGAQWGTGKRAGWLGSLILACRDSETGDFLECGMMGSGLKEKKTEEGDTTMAEITNMLKPLIIGEDKNEVKVKPNIVVEVSYEEIQKSPKYISGYALRFPRFIRLRTDEKPASNADTLKRVESLYLQQKGKIKN